VEYLTLEFLNACGGDMEAVFQRPLPPKPSDELLEAVQKELLANLQVIATKWPILYPDTYFHQHPDNQMVDDASLARAELTAHASIRKNADMLYEVTAMIFRREHARVLADQKNTYHFSKH